jgi:hypothetical protein
MPDGHPQREARRVLGRKTERAEVARAVERAEEQAEREEQAVVAQLEGSEGPDRAFEDGPLEIPMHSRGVLSHSPLRRQVARGSVVTPERRNAVRAAVRGVLVRARRFGAPLSNPSRSGCFMNPLLRSLGLGSLRSGSLGLGSLGLGSLGLGSLGILASSTLVLGSCITRPGEPDVGPSSIRRFRPTRRPMRRGPRATSR